MKTADIFYKAFPGVTTLLIASFPCCTNMLPTHKLLLQKETRKSATLLVLRKVFSSFEFYDLVFKVQELASYFFLFDVSYLNIILPRKCALSWMCSLRK